jgi:AbrB family looped-hinge helix DNA binding protein
MKTAVTISRRGAVTLPAKLRQALGLRSGDQLIAETTPQGLLLRRAPLVGETYTAERAREFDEGEAELAGVLRRGKAAIRRKTAANRAARAGQKRARR